jgi:hypothetical protein
LAGRIFYQERTNSPETYSNPPSERLVLFYHLALFFESHIPARHSRSDPYSLRKELKPNRKWGSDKELVATHFLI